MRLVALSQALPLPAGEGYSAPQSAGPWLHLRRRDRALREGTGQGRGKRKREGKGEGKKRRQE